MAAAHNPRPLASVEPSPYHNGFAAPHKCATAARSRKHIHEKPMAHRLSPPPAAPEPQPGSLGPVSLGHDPSPPHPHNPVVVAALYKFVAIPDFADRREPLQSLCEAIGVRGTLLLALEGVNGTIAGTRSAIDQVLAHLRAVPGCEDLDVKESHAEKMPFIRMKVRLKREIVTMGRPGIDPRQTVGTYVEPEDWNELISSEDVIVVDTRNDYEVEIGTFKGAIDPKTTSFREFPAWAEEALKRGQNAKIAMFCTGGIRCEKATALLKEMGHQEVYHLKGGILKYLERIDASDSLWSGECFVFDQRVSVGHGLKPGPLQLCALCRRPFENGDKRGGYAETPCPDCRVNADARKTQRAAERQKQLDLARNRGVDHFATQRKPSGASTIQSDQHQAEGER